MTSNSRPDVLRTDFEFRRVAANPEETLVIDDRAQLRPSEQVQTRLLTMLRSVAVPVSALHARREVRRAAVG